jgi:hypothetical protein
MCISKSIIKEQIKNWGKQLDRWKYKGVQVDVYIDAVPTIYVVNSKDEGNGYCTELLTYLKSYYKGLVSTQALSPAMEHILNKLNIKQIKL